MINGTKLVNDTAAKVADVLVHGAPAPKKPDFNTLVLVHFEAYRVAVKGGKVGLKLRFADEVERTKGAEAAAEVRATFNLVTFGELRARSKRQTKSQALRDLGLVKGKAADGTTVWE